MKFNSPLIVACLILQMSCPAVFAGTFTYEPAPSEPLGSFKGQAAVNKIGGLYGQDLSAFLDDKTIYIQRSSEKGKKTIAAGVVFKLQTKMTSGGLLLTGLWYGKDGEELDAVLERDKGGIDIVQLKDGSSIGGKLTSCSSNEITIQTDTGMKRVSASSVETVKSAKVFEFTCKLDSVQNPDLNKPFTAEGETMIFKSTFNSASAKQWDKQQQKAQAKSNAPSSEGWSKKKKILVVTIAVLLIATAIAVPIAVAVPAAANQQRRERNQRNAAFAALSSSFFAPRQTQPVNNQNRNRNNQNQN